MTTFTLQLDRPFEEYIKSEEFVNQVGHDLRSYIRGQYKKYNNQRLFCPLYGDYYNCDYKYGDHQDNDTIRFEIGDITLSIDKSECKAKLDACIYDEDFEPVYAALEKAFNDPAPIKYITCLFYRGLTVSVWDKHFKPIWHQKIN